MSNDNNIKIDVSPEVAKGEYSNLAIITHSHTEFILDFASMLPGLSKPQVHNRIIMNPEHAKRLLLALQDNIAKYENQNGPIVLPQAVKGTFPMGFGGGNGTKS